MNTITSFFTKLRIRQILTIFLASVLVLTSTACNPGNAQGARPNNPPVQAGGMNNPHKGGGDGYTNYKMSTDPSVKSSNAKPGQDRSELPVISHQLIATVNSDSNATKLLYQGSEPLQTDKFDQELGGDKALLTSPGTNPKQRQPIVNRTDPDAQILERVGAAFKDASSFLKDSSEEAGTKAVVKGNPLQK